VGASEEQVEHRQEASRDLNFGRTRSVCVGG
jgi:hypothetical protein